TDVTSVVRRVYSSSGAETDRIAIYLTGQFTHFVQETTTASFGAGITVATLTVNSATTATAVVNIDPAAATGSRNVTVTTGGEVRSEERRVGMTEGSVEGESSKRKSG